MAACDHVPQTEIGVDNNKVGIASDSKLPFAAFDTQQPRRAETGHRDCFLGEDAR